MQQTSSSSKRKMGSYDQSKTTDQSTNEQKRIETSSHSYPKRSTDSVDANSSLNSTFNGDITIFASKQKTNGKQPF